MAQDTIDIQIHNININIPKHITFGSIFVYRKAVAQNKNYKQIFCDVVDCWIKLCNPNYNLIVNDLDDQTLIHILQKIMDNNDDIRAFIKTNHDTTSFESFCIAFNQSIGEFASQTYQMIQPAITTMSKVGKEVNKALHHCIPKISCETPQPPQLNIINNSEWDITKGALITEHPLCETNEQLRQMKSDNIISGKKQSRQSGAGLIISIIAVIVSILSALGLLDITLIKGILTK